MDAMGLSALVIGTIVLMFIVVVFVVTVRTNKKYNRRNKNKEESTIQNDNN